MTTSALARRYARAILELASEQKQAERVGKELAEFAAMWSSSDELRKLFESPKINAEARKQVLVELITRAAVSPLVKNSILYMADRRRITALPEVAAAYAHQAERAAGTLRAEVTSAVPLPDTYYAQLQRSLEQATGRKVTIEKKTDKNLIAGVVTRVGDRVLDGSVRARLTELKESLTSS
jgi:F-type H+-transporting ATPase subunit delta